jgi:hypothetical protein
MAFCGALVAFGDDTPLLAQDRGVAPKSPKNSTKPKIEQNDENPPLLVSEPQEAAIVMVDGKQKRVLLISLSPDKLRFKSDPKQKIEQRYFAKDAIAKTVTLASGKVFSVNPKTRQFTEYDADSKSFIDPSDNDQNARPSPVQANPQPAKKDETTSKTPSSVIQTSAERVRLVRELAAKRGECRSAAEELESLRKMPPDLEIGEFESDDKFQMRKNAAETAWKKSISEHAARLATMNRALDDVTKTTAERLLELDREPTLPISVEFIPHDPQLPKFDRATMQFKKIHIGPPPQEHHDGVDKTALVKLIFPELDLEIASATLEDAERFKREYEAGRLHFAWRVHPHLIHAESPIIVNKGTVRTVTERGHTPGSVTAYLLTAAFAVAIGADMSKLPSVSIAQDVTKETRIKVPPETRAGVRFHFECLPSRIIITDKDGMPFEGVKVVIPEFDLKFEEYVRVEEVRKDSQPAARVLQRGDEVISIDGEDIHTVEELIVAVNSVPAGRTFKVTYRHLQNELAFEAVGGSLLGVHILTVTRRREALLDALSKKRKVADPFVDSPRDPK